MKTLCRLPLLVALPTLLLAPPMPVPQPEPHPMPHPMPHPAPQQRPIAFTHVTVIDGTGARPEPDQTVLITGQQISALGRTGRVPVAVGAQVVDARGKFLIPGLWDMHVHISGFHVEKEQFLSMCLANGVTGVRDMGGNLLETFHRWRKEMQAGTRLGPRIVAAGPMVDGPEPSWPLISIPVGTAAEGRQAVRSLLEQGADFVKVYSRIPREAYFAIADECKKQRIPFAGHVTIFVTPAEASDAGQKSIEHMNGILLACSTREDEIKQRGNVNQSIGEIVDTYSDQKASALFAHFVKNQTWQVPTLTVRRAGAFIDDLASTHDERLKYISLANRERWKSELVEAGLTPMEALQAATRNPARFLGRTDLGTVEEGRTADLVLLEADPLEDIRNTTRIAAVVVGGRLLPKAALEAMLAGVEAAASKS
jgi:hypothetical protein